jgi:hypothetical protein
MKLCNISPCLRPLFRICILVLSLFMLFQGTALALPNTNNLAIADFEGGVDPRGQVASVGGLIFSSIAYAWENPPTPAGNDINYWDSYSDGDGVDEYVDYNFTLNPPQDWRNYTTFRISYNTWCDGGCNGNRAIRIFIHDADGTGNNSGQGYQNLGTFYQGSESSPATMDLTGVANRDQINEVKIRVQESFFSSLNVAGARQRTHLSFMDVYGNVIKPNIVSSVGRGVMLTKPNYDYAPSVMNDNGIYRMWWCGLKQSSQGDAIWYATSTNAINWSTPQQVLTATPNSQESNGQATGHTCDPSVVKVNGTFYMYYTSAGLSGGNNQIFLATSTNGVNWTKRTVNEAITPVIPLVNKTGSYGIGQSVVFFLNGRFYQYYTHWDKGGEMLAISYDGVNWYDYNTSHSVSQNDGSPVFSNTGGDTYVPTYLKDRNVFMAVRVCGQPCRDLDVGRGLPARAQGVDYSFSSDGIYWEPNIPNSNSYTVQVGNSNPDNHNGGILTDPQGLVSGSQIAVYYGSGGYANSSTWDISRTDLTLQ